MSLEQFAGATWWTVTHLGSSSLLLPACLLLMWGLWRTRQTRALQWLVLTLGTAVGVTLVSKIAFYGWGVGIAAWDFTGVSGHTLLAAALLPLLLRGLPGLGHWGAVMGAGLATAVGISRVVVEAHSPSEVALAWLLGCAVAASVLLALGAARPRHPALIVAPLLLLGSFHTPAATYLPSHSWEVRVALWLSGQPQPFTRADLHGVGPLSPARP
ncbi:MAG: hypothetical protein A3E00_01485 [Curvibacter sp. RIFCSPHIGHO2_12_FULL_63_18]|uniref:phosphatase PAP2 family protein n=1 Tax=Rhodoferax sp. TaxID=50421 RepID=UPI0008B800BE|nr:phosphatase PAP2 family protein [Rhodoferax sp.]OGO94143.1 MAG: hypothetical protein A2037_05485 [Curvibacter sp. GWA2_63_95]OGP03319.1 MAG: hypothetical protein A3E00_01485 [Curvibacter sp. RIFCSPHIGHO2_12_FULL_63_18]HCX83427.1 phosphoesterase PA-phosphatase [Rhodoferax sp.]